MKTSIEILSNFADRLDYLIKDKNWNIKKFAEMIGIPRTTINSWLKKSKIPRADYVYMVAEFFNVTTDYLLGREN